MTTYEEATHKLADAIFEAARTIGGDVGIFASYEVESDGRRSVNVSISHGGEQVYDYTLVEEAD